MMPFQTDVPLHSFLSKGMKYKNLVKKIKKGFYVILLSMKQTKEGVIIPVKVVLRASCNQIVGWEGDHLRVRLNTVPEKGAANSALIELIAKSLGVSKSSVELISGQTSRRKLVLVRGIPLSDIQNRFKYTETS